ncbi:MAG: M4 family metallopeptidase, partial [Bacteroidetes bacterium]|nr:M4 family metallopeptidase [Bacteroidota bacterium]
TTSENNAANFLKTFLANNSADVNFTIYNDEVDNRNIRHQKFRQIYKGIEVYNGQYFVHSRNGFIETANGNYIPVSLTNITPSLTESQALTYALNNINATSYMWQNPSLEARLKQNQNNPNATYYPVGELIILPQNGNSLVTDKLAYTFNIAVANPFDVITIMVDANSGDIIEKKSELCSYNVTGLANTKYSGTQTITSNNDGGIFKLEVLNSNGSKKIITNKYDNSGVIVDVTNSTATWQTNWLNTNSEDKIALDAHWAAEQTLGYWSVRHNRNAVNTKFPNMPLQSFVHFGPGGPTDAAFFDPTQNQMFYGDGNTFFNELTSLDVCAHEVGHGIDQATSKLNQGASIETFAIMESLSDIWAACAENYVNTPGVLPNPLPNSNKKKIWTSGEEVTKNVPYLRNLRFPKLGYELATGLPIQSPDCYLSNTWNTMLTDYPDGHYANGVMNKWFYILSQGETGTNEIPNSYSVTGVTIEVAEQILYKAQLYYLPSNAQFIDVRRATIQAAIDLFYPGSPEEIAVTNAWYAVNVGPIYQQGNSCITAPTTTLQNQLLRKTYNGGFYYLPANTKVTGKVTFNNATIYVNAGAEISIENGGQLILNGAHILTCSGLWKGIAVKAGGELNTFGTSNSTLIEDAEIAVYYNDIANNKKITLDNTIFNRNNIGVKIENYNLDNAITYPFSVKNCIFTSRQITDASGNWDNIATIKGGGVSGNYNSTFISNATYPDNVATAYLKDVYTTGYTTKKPVAGIMLINTGSFDGQDYHKIVIGDNSTATNANVFDNVDYGIKAERGCLGVTNCVFQKPNPNNATPNTNAIGIYVDNESGKYIYNGTNHPMRDVAERIVEITTPNTGDPNNTFFDMNTAVKIIGSNVININNCDIRSTQSITDLANKKGSFGIYIKNSYCERIDVLNNLIYNVRNGIYVANSVAYQDLYPKFGDLAVNSNHIYKDLAGAADATGNEYTNNAITLECLVSGNDLADKNVGCNNNFIENVFNGISVRNWLNKTVELNTNEITLAQDNYINTTTEKFGILMQGGTAYNGTTLGNKIVNNTITGFGINTTRKSSAIWVQQQSNTNIECNTVKESYNGFKFIGSNLDIKWWNNTMKATNKYGLLLEQGGIIGQQGDFTPTSTVKVCTSDNVWEGGLTAWNPAQQHYMTVCDGSDAGNSLLVINSNPLNDFLNPENSSKSSNGGNEYSNTNGLYKTISNPSCPRCNGLSNYSRIAPTDMSNYEQIADGIINLPIDNANERLYTMKQQLYELLQQNPDIASQSTSLQQFVLDNHWNSLDFINYTAFYLSQGDLNTVNSLLGFWPGQEDLDENYYTYFSWMANMQANPEYKPELDDVNHLANLCPLTNGKVVYAARNLYNALTERINDFEDNCNGGAMGKGVKKGMIRLNQPKPKINNTVLLVYPNPAKNAVNILYKNMVSIAVLDLTGRVVREQKLVKCDSANIDLYNLTNGLYILKVTTIDGKIKTEKIVKQ